MKVYVALMRGETEASERIECEASVKKVKDKTEIAIAERIRFTIVEPYQIEAARLFTNPDGPDYWVNIPIDSDFYLRPGEELTLTPS